MEIRSSREPRGKLRGPAAGLLAALLAGGCAHAPREYPARPPAPSTAPPARTETQRPAPRTPGPPEAPERLDPTEEITPEELATIPEPVPMGGPARSPRSQLPGGSFAGGSVPEPGPNASRVDSVAPAPSAGVWRVQIYASESREEADRVGRSAAARLGTDYVIQREGDLYKVRLGTFGSEDEAGALRDRAVRAGYPGAFRTLARP